MIYLDETLTFNSLSGIRALCVKLGFNNFLSLLPSLLNDTENAGLGQNHENEIEKDECVELNA